MEFVKGRIFENYSIPDVTPEERKEIWKSAIQTLALLHSIPPSSINLSTYGAPSSFYSRQISTWRKIHASQSATLDKETQKPVGDLPHFHDMLTYFSSNLPQDRTTIIHGDFKIDNLIYHPTEPRVIGIVDWELSTLGHPLSDLANLMTPYAYEDVLSTAPEEVKTHAYQVGFREEVGIPTKKEMLGWYAEIAGWDPSEDMSFAFAFTLMRGSCIFHGIAARYAMRVASSAKAKENGERRWGYDGLAWEYTKRYKKEREERAEKEDGQSQKAKL